MKIIITAWQAVTIFTLRMVFTLFAGLKVEGIHFLELVNRPVIFIANHRSMLDPFIICAAFPPQRYRDLLPNRYATHVKFMRMFFLRPFLLLWGCFPISPKTGTIEEILRPALDIARDKTQGMFVFPEGRIVRAGDESRARPGIAYIAKNSKRLILPVGISGSSNVSAFKFFTFRNQFTVRFGQPFYYHEIAGENDDLIHAAEKMMVRVNKLIEAGQPSSQELSWAERIH